MRKKFFAKAALTLIAALFGLTEANAQTVVSDVTATHVGPTYATINWTGNYNRLRYRTEGTQHVYDFEGLENLPTTTNNNNVWTSFDANGDNLGWVVYSSNTVYTSYEPGPDGHNSTEMLASGSYVSNSNSDYSNQDITPNNYLVSPQVTLGGTISFWAKGLDPIDCAEVFGVYIYQGNNKPTRESQFTQVGSDKTTTGEWTQYVFNLGTSDATGYVAICHHNCSGQDMLCIDDVVITEPGGNWTTITSGISGTSYNLTGLTEVTGYQVEVVYSRNANNITWTNAVGTRFSTTGNNPAPADISANPVGQFDAQINWFGLTDNYRVEYRKDAKDGPQYFFDDFEDGLGQWTVFRGITGQGPDDSPNGWELYSSDHFKPHAGSNAPIAWSWRGHNSYYANNWLITPKVLLGNKVKFWVQTSPGYPDEFEVLLSTTNNASITAADTTTFTTVLRALTPAPRFNGWTRVTLDIPSDLVDTEGYIAIHHKMYDGNYLYIDDFGLFGDDVPGSDGWPAGTTSALTTTLQELIPNTQYEYRITSILNGDEATSDIYTFTTQKLANLELADAGENTDLIHSLAGASDVDVTLVGRTLVGGKWNTLCLPFALTRLTGTPLANADIRELTAASFDVDNDKTLTLTFSPVSQIKSGVAYIVKPSSSISEPVFSSVVIREGLNPKKCEFGDNMSITFRGTYDKITDFVEQLPGVNSRNSVLFMNSNNQLVYPSSTAYLNSQRALFILSGIVAGPVGSNSNGIKAFVVNIEDDDPTGIEDLNVDVNLDEPIYNVAGQRLNKMQKGINIVNGKKILK